MRFTTTIEQAPGMKATGIVVPDNVVTELGRGKKPPVTVTINGYTYRNTIAAREGRCMISVSSEVRTKAGVAAGDEVEVDIELDDQPREVTVPEDLTEALKAEPKAAALWETMSYSQKSRHVLAIEGAKAEETRLRRIAKSIADLKAGKK